MMILGLKFLIVTQVIFTLTITFTKLSMLSLVHRIMKDGNSYTLQVLTYLAFSLVAIDGFIFITVVVFQCRYGFLLLSSLKNNVLT